MATDWHNRLYSSTDITEGGYILADTCNGAALPEKDGETFAPGDGNWPLTLVGEEVSEESMVHGIESLTIVFAEPDGGERDEGVQNSPSSLLIAVVGLSVALLVQRRA